MIKGPDGLKLSRFEDNITTSPEFPITIETSEIFNKNKQKSDFLEKITFFDEKT